MVTVTSSSTHEGNEDKENTQFTGPPIDFYGLIDKSTSQPLTKGRHRDVKPITTSLNTNTLLRASATMRGNGMVTPPASQSPTDVGRSVMLISPPPENVLRLNEGRNVSSPSVLGLLACDNLTYSALALLLL